MTSFTFGRLVAVAASFACLPGIAEAFQTPVPDGPEFLVNTTTADNQRLPSVAALSGGGYVITWYDSSATGGDTSSNAIRAQRYDAAGATDGAEFLINTTTTNSQSYPSVAALSGGGFVITWQDESATGGDTSGYAIRAQRYDAAGATDGAEFLVNTTTAGFQAYPSVAALSGGGFVITWQDPSATGGDTSGTAIRAQLYDAAGATDGAEFLVNTTITGNQELPSVAALSGGGFVITWKDASMTGGDTSGYAVRAQRYDAAGATDGTEFLVNTTTASSQGDPTVAALSGGGFVITWQDASLTGGDTSSWAIRAQLYDAAGAADGTEFLVNTTTAGAQFLPSVDALSGGGFIITWQDDSATGGDTSGLAIRAQRYDAAGAIDGVEFLVNTTTAGNQSYPSIAALSGNGFVITWQDDSQTGGDTTSDAIRAQRFAFSTLAANSRVIDGFVTAASDFGDSGTTEIADGIDFSALDVTGDLQFAVVVQNTDQFDGIRDAVVSIELDGAVFDGHINSSVFASGGSCSLTISTGGLDGGTSAGFATSDLAACDDRVADRVYSAGADDDDMVFTLPVRLTGSEVNFSVDVSTDYGTQIGSDTHDLDDSNSTADPVATGVTAFAASSYGTAARTAGNLLGVGEVTATLASDYNSLDSTALGTLEASVQGQVYAGGSLVAADLATHADTVTLTLGLDDTTGLDGLALAGQTASFNMAGEAVFVIDAASTPSLADLAAGALAVTAVPDSDAATAIAANTLEARVDLALDPALTIADSTATGGANAIVREASTAHFEWVGDSTMATRHVFRLTGLGTTLPTIRARLDNASSGLSGSYELTPVRPLINGELVLTNGDIQTAVGQPFGRADITLEVEALGVTMRRFAVTNGVISEMATDNAVGGAEIGG
ncbi:beta strand repeat-containing protein [Maricaulis sp. CAU 1757]